MSYTLFILLLRVWDAILGFCLIQYKTKQNRTLGQNGHWLSPVPCVWQGACLAFWLWGEGEKRREKRRRTQCCAQSSALKVGSGEANTHICLGGHQTLEELRMRWAFSLGRKKMTSSPSLLPKGPGCCQVWDALARPSCHLAGWDLCHLPSP